MNTSVETAPRFVVPASAGPHTSPQLCTTPSPSHLSPAPELQSEILNFKSEIPALTETPSLPQFDTLHSQLSTQEGLYSLDSAQRTQLAPAGEVAFPLPLRRGNKKRRDCGPQPHRAECQISIACRI